MSLRVIRGPKGVLCGLRGPRGPMRSEGSQGNLIWVLSGPKGPKGVLCGLRGPMGSKGSYGV